MTDITAAAQEEADKRWPANHIVDDPFGETGYAETDPYGYDDTANKAFVQGAEWAMNQILTDWEYGIRSRRTGNAWVVEREMFKHEERVRRRKAGPWEAVEGAR